MIATILSASQYLRLINHILEPNRGLVTDRLSCLLDYHGKRPHITGMSQ
jgi:hypothetical protein